jgi:hypothetical protein
VSFRFNPNTVLVSMAGLQRRDQIGPGVAGELGGRDPGIRIGGGDLCLGHTGAVGIGDGSLDAATGGVLSFKRRAPEQHQASEDQPAGEEGAALCEKTA